MSEQPLRERQLDIDSVNMTNRIWGQLRQAKERIRKLTWMEEFLREHPDAEKFAKYLEDTLS
jgi:hypothetical protein